MAATIAATGATAAMLGLLPVVNPAAIQLPQSEPKSAASAADVSTAQDSSAAPAPPAAEDSAPAALAPLNQLPVTGTLSAPLPAALPELPMPHLPAELGVPLRAAANSSLPAPTPNSSAPNRSAGPQPAATNAMPPADISAPQAAVGSGPGAQPLPAQPPPAASQIAPAMEAAAAAPSAGSEISDPSKIPAAFSGNHKSPVTNLLRSLASAAGKTVETVAHATATAARDVAGALKEKASATPTSQAVAALANTAGKTQAPANAKPESASPQLSGKAAPAKNTGNSGDADNNDAPSAKSETTADAPATSKAKPAIADAASPQVAQPQQAVAANSSTMPAAALSASAAAKEPSLSAKSPAAAQENNSPAPPDSDEVKLPVLDSKVVNVAQLTGNDAHSEVRIAMQADQLGQVELHATLNGQQVGAAITVEKKEAHAAMAVELPSLQQALEEKNLRVSEVVLSQSAMHSTSGDAGKGGNAPAEQRQNPIGRQYLLPEAENSYPAAPGAILDTAVIFDGYGRLSVRV